MYAVDSMDRPAANVSSNGGPSYTLAMITRRLLGTLLVSALWLPKVARAEVEPLASATSTPAVAAGDGASTDRRKDESHPVFDGHAGIPILSTHVLHLNGTALGAYHAKQFSAGGSVGYSNFDLSGDDVTVNNSRASGNAFGSFVLLRPSNRLRFEGHGALGVSLYGSSFHVQATRRIGFSHDETSTMGRGTFGLALRWQPAELWAVNIGAAGGAQYEVHNYQRTDPQDQTSDESRTKTTARGQLQASVGFRAFPNVIAFRLRADASLFSITRDALFTGRAPPASTSSGATPGPGPGPTAGPGSGANPSTGTASPTTSTASQESSFLALEAGARLFVDVEKLSFFGFVPGICGGVDLFAMNSNQGSNSVVVPIVAVSVGHAAE